MNIQKASVLLMTALFAAGCGPDPKNDPSLKVEAPSAEVAAPAARALDAAAAGTLSGRIFFDGEAPAPKMMPIQGNPECSVLHTGGAVMSEDLLVKNGGLANAFVYIKEGLEGYVFPPAPAPLVVSNTKCVYIPHVAGARVGQDVVFRNDDATLHNVHSYSKTNKSFNLGLPLINMKQTKKFTAPEVMVSLKCDVHPWMLGYIGVLDHPCFAVSDAEGNFSIAGIPPGEYTVEVWHEKLGTQTQKITVAAQGAHTAEFRFSAAA